MRRFRLEAVLVVFLVGALAVALVLRGTPGDPAADLGDTETSDPLGRPTPCIQALLGEPAPGPAAADADVASVAPLVEEIRELSFEEEPEPVYLAPGPLRERVDDMVDEIDDRLEIQGRLLAELGALPEQIDLGREVEDLLGEQVAGFYDSETEELVVAADAIEEGLSTTELLTLVHELEHALADQRLGIPDLDTLNDEDQDAASAAQSLVEGDAQLTTEIYAARSLSPSDQLAAIGEEVPGLDDVPHYLARSLLFPYVEGARFACALYREGGWDAVDDAYLALPRSTAEILFPDRYGSGDEPTDPPDPRGLPAPWEEAETLTFGAADLLFLFEAPGDDPTHGLAGARDLVRPWAGGEVHVWTWGERTAVGLVLAASDGEALCGSVTAWWQRAAGDAEERTQEVPGSALATEGPERGGVLYCEGGSVRLGIGPELAVARAAVR